MSRIQSVSKIIHLLYNYIILLIQKIQQHQPYHWVGNLVVYDAYHFSNNNAIVICANLSVYNYIECGPHIANSVRNL